MAPPTYGDLGKASRDVFGKGYHFSLVKLDVKTKTASGKIDKATPNGIDYHYQMEEVWRISMTCIFDLVF